jgi:hypothetical protein
LIPRTPAAVNFSYFFLTISAFFLTPSITLDIMKENAPSGSMRSSISSSPTSNSNNKLKREEQTEDRDQHLHAAEQATTNTISKSIKQLDYALKW